MFTEGKISIFGTTIKTVSKLVLEMDYRSLSICDSEPI